MKFKVAISSQFFLFCFLLFIALACTNPIEVGNKTQAGHRSVVGRVDEQSQIRAIFASPVENKLGIVTAKNEIDLLQVSNTRFDGPLLLKENFFNTSLISAPLLSPQAKRIAFVKPPQLIIIAPSDSSRQTYSFGQGTFQEIKWSSSARFLNILYFDGSRYNIYRIDAIAQSRTLLYQEDKRHIRLMDFLPSARTIYFYGSPRSSFSSNYLYFYNTRSAKMDSLSANRQITALAVSNDGLKIALVQATIQGNTTIKILDYPAQKIIARKETGVGLSSPFWKSDDNQILFSADSGDYVIYTPENSTCERHSLSKRFDGTLLEKVWGSANNRINCLGLVHINNLSLLNTNSKNKSLLLHVRQSQISSPAWSADGKQIAYIQKDAVYLYDPAAGIARKIQVPFPFSKLLRWGPKADDLSFLYNDGQQNFLYLFNITTHKSIKIKIPQSERVNDFSWIPGAHTVSFAFPEIPGIIFFNFNGTSLSDRSGSALDISTLRWSANKALIATIGNYAVIQGKSTLGIYFQSRSNINWLLHLTLRNATYYDWCSDGKSLYYSGLGIMDDNQIYREQVIFTNH